MKFGLLLIMLGFASENQENKVESAKSVERLKEHNAEDLILVKIEEDNYTTIQKKTSKYIGVSYNESKARYIAQRWNKNESKSVSNGTYKNEETAAHASDTLARKFMANCKQKLTLNFPDKNIEVNAGKKINKYVGVSYHKRDKLWFVHRRSGKDKKVFYNGTYKDEKTAAHASDTLARKLMDNGEQSHKLNFPHDHTEVNPKKRRSSSKYIGVSYSESKGRWDVARRSKYEHKIVHTGNYKNEETAAHASDILARKLMANGEQNHKLNFPNENTKEFPDAHQRNKRKRSHHDDLGHFQNK